MKYKFTKIILLTAVVAGLTTACTPAGENTPTGKRYEFNNILDIAYTPDTDTLRGMVYRRRFLDGIHPSAKRSLGERFLRSVQSGHEPAPMDGAIRCHRRL